MITPDYPLTSATALERIVRRAERAERVGAVCLLAVVLGAIWFWVDHYSGHMFGLSVGLFVGTLWLAWPDGEEWETTHLDDATPAILGRFTADQIRAAIDEVRRSYGEREHPNIYIVPTSMPVAMTRNASIINFVRSWNAVWISTHLLEVLTEDELKSIFAHEMCHFSQHTTFWGRYFYVHALSNAVLVTFAYIAALDWFFDGQPGMSGLLISVAVFAAIGLFPLVMFLGNLVVVGVSLLTERGDSQAVESLCDYEAAKRYGPIPMTNALLKVSTRTELFTRVVAAFASDETEGGSDDEDDEDEEDDPQGLGAQAAIAHLEEHLPMAFLSVEDAQPYIDDAIDHAAETVEGVTVKRHPARTFLKWLKYDNRVRNQRLDLGEYEDFIAAIHEAPEQPLFDIPEECDAELEAAAEHPSIRNRVLFLAHNLPPKALSS